MTITITAEDGSGNPAANSYVTELFADAYHAERGNTYWAAVAADLRRACLVKATDYIDKRFGDKFRGYRMQKDQALAWPRLAAFDDDNFTLDDVPTKLKKATVEYAVRAAIYNVLAPDPIRTTPAQDMSDNVSPNADTTDLTVGPLKSKSVKVGPIEKVVTYDGVSQLASSNQRGSRASQSTVLNDIYVPQYPEADMLIEHLIDNSIATSLERA